VLKSVPAGVALMLATLIIGAPACGSCPASSAPLAPLPAARFEDGPTISQLGLTSDFDGWLRQLHTQNPDLSIRSDLKALNREAAQIRRSLTVPMSSRQAWARFALLNPWLGDGHSGIGMPDYREALAAYVSGGGSIVPIEVRFAKDSALRVFAVSPGTVGIERGDRLDAINGHSAPYIVQEMLRRAQGDSIVSRQAWVSRRFAALYRLLFGDSGSYDVQVTHPESGCVQRVRSPGAKTLPASLLPQPALESLFSWRIFGAGVGYFRVDDFDPDARKALAASAHAAFKAFADGHIRALIIDVRENGGGDDPLWQESLMEYLTDKPYSELSSYIQKVTAQHADPGDVVGSIKRAKYKERITPTPDNPLRFSGTTYILIGPYSYSATIQFVVAAQDFGVAKIAGAPSGALSCQTGQVQRLAMPKTGLNAYTPAIAYTRPSGVGCRRPVVPDVRLDVDEVNPDATLMALVARASR
jgi:hypothetical protein